jgi:hypothetical protein
MAGERDARGDSGFQMADSTKGRGGKRFQIPDDGFDSAEL